MYMAFSHYIDPFSNDYIYIWPACSGIDWNFSSRLLGESVLQSSVSLLKFRTRLFVASHVLVEQLDVECPLKGLCVR